MVGVPIFERFGAAPKEIGNSRTLLNLPPEPAHVVKMTTYDVKMTTYDNYRLANEPKILEAPANLSKPGHFK